MKKNYWSLVRSASVFLLLLMAFATHYKVRLEMIEQSAGILEMLADGWELLGPPQCETWEADGTRHEQLAALTPDRLFASYFGLDKTGWRNQPMVRRLSCAGDCGATLAQAVADAGGSPMIWVNGDLRVDGPVALGSAQHPVALVVEGSVQFSGAVRLHGVLYGSGVGWDNTGTPGALLRGALITDGNVQGSGAPDIFYDAAVLAALKAGGGSFARVSGSWRDF